MIAWESPSVVNGPKFIVPRHNGLTRWRGVTQDRLRAPVTCPRCAPLPLHVTAGDPGAERHMTGVLSARSLAPQELGDVGGRVAGGQRARALAVQAHPEGGAASLRRLHLDVAAERGDELLGDVQAEAHAGAVRAGGAGLAKAL